MKCLDYNRERVFLRDCQAPGLKTASVGTVECLSTDQGKDSIGKGTFVSCMIDNQTRFFLLTAAHNLPASWRSDRPQPNDGMQITMDRRSFTLSPPYKRDVFYDDFCDVALVPIQSDPRLMESHPSSLSIVPDAHLSYDGPGALIRSTYTDNDLSNGDSGKGLRTKSGDVFCVHSQREKKADFMTGAYDRRGTNLHDIWQQVNNGNQRTAMWDVLSQFVPSSDWVDEDLGLQQIREADEQARAAEMAQCARLLPPLSSAVHFESMVEEEDRPVIELTKAEFNRFYQKKGASRFDYFEGLLLTKLGNEKIKSDVDFKWPLNEKPFLIQFLVKRGAVKFDDDIHVEFDDNQEEFQLTGNAEVYHPPLREALCAWLSCRYDKSKEKDLDDEKETTKTQMKKLWRDCQSNDWCHKYEWLGSYDEYEANLMRGRYVEHLRHPKLDVGLHKDHAHTHWYCRELMRNGAALPVKKITFVFV